MPLCTDDWTTEHAQNTERPSVGAVYLCNHIDGTLRAARKPIRSGSKVMRRDVDAGACYGKRTLHVNSQPNSESATHISVCNSKRGLVRSAIITLSTTRSSHSGVGEASSDMHGFYFSRRCTTTTIISLLLQKRAVYLPGRRALPSRIDLPFNVRHAVPTERTNPSCRIQREGELKGVERNTQQMAIMETRQRRLVSAARAIAPFPAVWRAVSPT